jgi:DNA polymerase-3 subunit alpha
MGLDDIEKCVAATAGDLVKAAGIISSVQVRYSKKGNRFCVFRIEDRSGGIKCIAWGESFSKYKDILKEDDLVVIGGKIEASEGQDTTLIVSDVQSLSDAMFANARGIELTIPVSTASSDYIDELFTVFSGSPGSCDVYLNLEIDGMRLKLHSQPLKVRGSRNLEAELRSRGCEVEWMI